MRRLDERHLTLPCREQEAEQDIPTRRATGRAPLRVYADDEDGDLRPVSQASHQYTAYGASDLSLPVAPSDDHPFPSRVEIRQLFCMVQLPYSRDRSAGTCSRQGRRSWLTQDAKEMHAKLYVDDPEEPETTV
jgi:hypothetical protein